MTALSARRNNPIIQSWRVKAGSDLLSGAATIAVEKVFLAEVTPASPKDNDIALVKLRSPVHDSGGPARGRSHNCPLIAPSIGLGWGCLAWQHPMGTEC